MAWPEHGWTAKRALDELGCGAYHVCGVEIRDGMLHITADENPWDFGSYRDGEWYDEPTNQYEVHFGAIVYVQEPNEEAALHMAAMRIEDGDFDYEETEIVNVS